MLPPSEGPGHLDWFRKLHLFKFQILCIKGKMIFSWRNLTEVYVIYNSVQFSHSVMSNSFRSHGLQHDRLPYPSPVTGACSNSGPLSGWCNPTISSSVDPFRSCLQSFLASGSFPMPILGLYCQTYGFSSSHIWMWELDHKETWAPMNWCFWTVVLEKALESS